MLRQIPVSKMAISLSLAILAALTLIGINEVGYTRSSSALESIHRSQQTRSTLNQLLRNMLNAETGQRGFLLTGDAKYLEPYQSAVTQIDENLSSCPAPTRATPRCCASSPNWRRTWPASCRRWT